MTINQHQKKINMVDIKYVVFMNICSCLYILDPSQVDRHILGVTKSLKTPDINRAETSQCVWTVYQHFWNATQPIRFEDQY